MVKKIDKLTLLHEIPKQRKEGIVSAMISLVTDAKRLRKRRPKPGDVWHLDEVFIRMNGTLHYLWRAVDQHGVMLDIFVQDRRNAAAAKRFFRRLLHGLKYKPRRRITDGLRSYGVAHREVMPDVRH